MATQKVYYQTSTYIPLVTSPCQTVYLCLGSAWGNRTASGLTLIKATLGQSGRALNDPRPAFENPRGVKMYEYELFIDDTQLLVNSETSAKWLVSCSDISELNPYVCTVDALLGTVGFIPDTDSTPVTIGTMPTIAGLSLQTYRAGNEYTLIFTLDGVLVSITDADASGSYGSLKIFDFVQQAIHFLGTRQNYTDFDEGAALTTAAGDAAFKIGVGSVAIAAAADAVLGTTNKNIGGEIAVTLSGGNGTGTLIEGDKGTIDGTATAVDIYINISGSAATIDASDTLAVDGQIQITLLALGDD